LAWLANFRGRFHNETHAVAFGCRRDVRSIMAHAVKISDTEYEAAREAAAVNSRSLSGQVEHWIRIGRAVERNPAIAYSRIEQALRGLLAPSELSDEEQEEYLDRLGDKMGEVSSEEAAFWADRDRRGLGVGLDDAGKLVYAASRN
jgi:hypothetical protein